MYIKRSVVSKEKTSWESTFYFSLEEVSDWRRSRQNNPSQRKKNGPPPLSFTKMRFVWATDGPRHGLERQDVCGEEFSHLLGYGHPWTGHGQSRLCLHPALHNGTSAIPYMGTICLSQTSFPTGQMGQSTVCVATSLAFCGSSWIVELCQCCLWFSDWIIEY